jgi:hypothetical protein
MIVRILGEGQYDVPDAALAELNRADADLQNAADASDPDRFGHALRALLGDVRRLGTPLPDREITASDLVLPAEDTPLTEVVAMLGDEGLIPG